MTSFMVLGGPKEGGFCPRSQDTSKSYLREGGVLLQDISGPLEVVRFPESGQVY